MFGVEEFPNADILYDQVFRNVVARNQKDISVSICLNSKGREVLLSLRTARRYPMHLLQISCPDRSSASSVAPFERSVHCRMSFVSLENLVGGWPGFAGAVSFLLPLEGISFALLCFVSFA
jgi:hypothetical protein